ncbi:MAG: regulatory iron-sulfur-containing complex subunit RicT [Candidatus Pacebacteria bacterium]|nr:regulatory iron-sulfur-containing complex subunit RicT [Candidatus Paceibacterota bacterium]MDR3583171.1 regulatory iron-sulfur-containing complex subunit RicT [Candidatus Paceibacterota bacterium]
MSNVLVLIYPWENPGLYTSSFEVEKGDKVIVPLENGNELGIVADVDIAAKDEPAEKIVRIATARDVEAYEKHEAEKAELLEACREEIKTQELPMKLIDARGSLDGKQIIFVFTADGRVDFRELVKVMAKKFKRLIRMQQIGSRDEARKLGGYGICGRELCCVKFPGSIPSITTDMARVQQIAHRGTERISGLCGRLMCCLAYEAEQYKKLLEGMPELYSVVTTPEGKATVIEINAETQEVKVKTESGKYVVFKKEDFR